MTGALSIGLVCAGLAGWLLGNGGRHRCRRGSGQPPHPRMTAASGPVLGLLAAGLVVWGAGAVGIAIAGPLAGAVVVAVTAAVWLSHRARERRRARAVAAEVVEACEGIASGLRAGLAPERVLARTSQDLPVLRSAAAAQRFGGDVPSALRTTASTVGADRLAMLAAAWEVARRSGAGLAEAVTRIAAAVRADQGRSRQVDAALAGARSTARLFAVLPVLGVALGTGMGADPVAVLTGSAAGAWCLCLGTVLAVTGLVWVERLADGAVR